MKPRVAVFVCLLLLAAGGFALAGGLPKIPSPSERWYRIDVQGRHAGWASEIVSDGPDRTGDFRRIDSELLAHVIWATDADLTLKIGPDELTAPQHYEIDFKQRIDSRIEYDAAGLRRSEFRIEDRAVKRRVLVERVGERYDVTVSTGRDTRKREVARSEFEATSNAIYELPEKWTKEGDAVQLKVLDLATGRILPRTFRLAGVEEVAVMGTPQRLRKFEVRDAEGSFTLWLDGTGLEARILQETGDTTMLYEQSGKKEAHDFKPPKLDLKPSDDHKATPQNSV